MSKYTISRFENNITLNPKEYVLDDEDKIIEFDTIDLAKKYLREHDITCFDGYDFDEVIDKDNFEDACCWDEDNNCVFGMESISPTAEQCLGCGEKYGEDERGVEYE